MCGTTELTASREKASSRSTETFFLEPSNVSFRKYFKTIPSSSARISAPMESLPSLEAYFHLGAEGFPVLPQHLERLVQSRGSNGQRIVLDILVESCQEGIVHCRAVTQID